MVVTFINYFLIQIQKSEVAATISKQKKKQTTHCPCSDAVLNCPACMTTLCLDCQRYGHVHFILHCEHLWRLFLNKFFSIRRHEKYQTQYRAMFVMNCTINKEEALRYKTAYKRKQNRCRKKARLETTSTSTEAEMESSAGLTDARLAGMDEEAIYHPVKCTECSTEVAVYDKDEVYHFFNILASHC